MEEKTDLAQILVRLDLFDKAREIYAELGRTAVLSYLKSSYRLLSKVYHPDLNKKNRSVAQKAQQDLNRLDHIMKNMADEDIIDVIKAGAITLAKEKIKILVVEDESGLQELFRDIFQMEGYDVEVAIDGYAGLEAYRRFAPDLVFTDIVMPKMNGLELIKKIREINPHVKVIYISGFFGIRGLKQELENEVSKYGYRTLSKPFRISKMLEKVKSYLEEESSEAGNFSFFA
ncbi:MAG: response regulator [Desulfatiglans sp.]|nr:response regulator [Thermodesulfobacteriota bacterium]MEE4353836.1 response regulator [Desulfatiglans sp.]